jgi:hypothetical protein
VKPVSRAWILSAIFAALVVGQAISPSVLRAQTRTIDDFNGSLFPGGQFGPEIVTWKRVPTPAQISQAFPRTASATGYTLWECQVTAVGHLIDCKMQAQWPRDDARYRIAAEKLLPLFQASAATVERALAERKTILFPIPVYRPGSTSSFGNECPPPFCVPVPPPPKS